MVLIVLMLWPRNLGGVFGPVAVSSDKGIESAASLEMLKHSGNSVTHVLKIEVRKTSPDVGAIRGEFNFMPDCTVIGELEYGRSGVVQRDIADKSPVSHDKSGALLYLRSHATE
jgi:hypothetical protein